MNTNQFKLSKSLWTQSDFEAMSWHDNRLHGVGIIDDFDPHEHEVRFDIDYIFLWSGHGSNPGLPGFWIAPSTLAFPARELSLAIGELSGYWIMEIERLNPDHAYEGGPVEWTWEISLNTGGLISLRSAGYAQYTRRAPIFLPCPNQCLETKQRGGISFEKLLYDA